MKSFLLIPLFFFFAFFSVCAQTVVGYTSFEDPDLNAGEYTDLGDASLAHDLINNPGEPVVDFSATGQEIGFDATYEPYDSPGTGLTDGDFVGVTDYTATVTAYTDGVKGYRVSDCDGNFILTFDTIDFSTTANNSVEMDYFLTSTSYEGDGNPNSAGEDLLQFYVEDLTNMNQIYLLNTIGNDIDNLNIEGQWNTLQAQLPNNIMARLVIKVRVNSEGESIFFDNILFKQNNLLSTEAEIRSFSITPNPVTNGVVSLKGFDAPIAVTLYNLSGQQVLRQTTSEVLDVRSLGRGLYLMRIHHRGQTIARKLVIE